MDNHIRWLYWSFDGGRDNQVDWREILACFKLMVYYKLIQPKTIELLISIFDIFASPGDNLHSK